MTPKEKALRLCQQYGVITFATKHNDGYTLPLEMAKQCALIAVDLKLDSDFVFYSIEFGEVGLEYWQQVKQELEKIKESETMTSLDYWFNVKKEIKKL
jgi:preprotein translocase subunit SecE